MNIFKLTIAAALALGLSTVALPVIAQSGGTAMDHAMHVAKSPTCGCCEAWVDLARSAGFEVTTTDMDDVTAAKSQVGVPQDLWSCHTAVVDGYVIEGHVPFDAIAKLLRDRPAITGISVPGMPMGSPGMGDDPAAQFDVIAFGGDAAPDEVYFEAGR
jgi:hypothetical protein